MGREGKRTINMDVSNEDYMMLKAICAANGITNTELHRQIYQHIRKHHYKGKRLPDEQSIASLTITAR